MERPHLPDEPLELFRSPRPEPCRERALVLRARGIRHTVRQVRGGFVLLVPAAEFEAAQVELSSYDEENEDWPPRESLPPTAPGVRLALITSAALLVLFYLLERSQAAGLDWWGLGRASGLAIRNGELWRTVTALTLHTGPPHLCGNLLFGAFFGFFACGVHGGGLGGLAILLAGVLGNLSNAWIREPDYLSVGASTAVFGAIGILAGSEWRRRQLHGYGSLRRFAPLLASFLFLAYLGMGGDQVEEVGRTDVLAHVTGFFWGIVLGVLWVALPDRWRTSSRIQATAAAVGLSVIAIAWAAAFTA